MRENNGPVMDEMLGWQDMLMQKTRRWPALSQGIRVLIGLMMATLVVRLFSPGGPFWDECALRIFCIALIYLC